MAGPFPGMDPYLEFQSSWPDFHNALIGEIRNELGVKLPDSYVARVDQRIEIANAPFEPPRSFQPDVLVGRFDEPTPQRETTNTSVAIALEPELNEVLSFDPDEFRITWVEIRALPELELVTALEILSPINKSRQGRKAYLEKRDQLHEARVNLVEIDLLLEGPPLPLKQRIAPGGYYAIVARGARLPTVELYRWSVRDPLPSLPIPLRTPDADIAIDLGMLVNRVYDLGRYSRTLQHGKALPETIAVTPDDRVWIESVGRSSLS